jgi:hypothetical protein
MTEENIRRVLQKHIPPLTVSQVDGILAEILELIPPERPPEQKKVLPAAKLSEQEKRASTRPTERKRGK